MDKQLSINLFLARAMDITLDEDGYFSPGEGQNMRYWSPHTDKAQCWKVVDWAVANNCNVDMFENLIVSIKEAHCFKIYYDGTDKTRSAATLEAIARALGWVEND